MNESNIINTQEKISEIFLNLNNNISEMINTFKKSESRYEKINKLTENISTKTNSIAINNKTQIKILDKIDDKVNTISKNVGLSKTHLSNIEKILHEGFKQSNFNLRLQNRQLSKFSDNMKNVEQRLHLISKQDGDGSSRQSLLNERIVRGTKDAEFAKLLKNISENLIDTRRQFIEGQSILNKDVLKFASYAMSEKGPKNLKYRISSSRLEKLTTDVNKPASMMELQEIYNSLVKYIGSSPKFREKLMLATGTGTKEELSEKFPERSRVRSYEDKVVMYLFNINKKLAIISKNASNQLDEKRLGRVSSKISIKDYMRKLEGFSDDPIEVLTSSLLSRLRGIDYTKAISATTKTLFGKESILKKAGGFVKDIIMSIPGLASLAQVVKKFGLKGVGSFGAALSLITVSLSSLRKQLLSTKKFEQEFKQSVEYEEGLYAGETYGEVLKNMFSALISAVNPVKMGERLGSFKRAVKDLFKEVFIMLINGIKNKIGEIDFDKEYKTLFMEGLGLQKEFIDNIFDFASFKNILHPKETYKKLGQDQKEYKSYLNRMKTPFINLASRNIPFLPEIPLPDWFKNEYKPKKQTQSNQTNSGVSTTPQQTMSNGDLYDNDRQYNKTVGNGMIPQQTTLIPPATIGGPRQPLTQPMK